MYRTILLALLAAVFAVGTVLAGAATTGPSHSPAVVQLAGSSNDPGGDAVSASS